ncbi:DNRLRE domain-containing protein [Blastococcus capsensis]|uniref:DNRLRE domain-containing protein n=2 Tax=Bacillati TaxID=1783272 RepID=UPI00253F6F19|nr:DNRLRE domain-containing protein [Blastococcus capsensis]MDK3257512.1 DNRLRE domain-containing protein [Blastococcus capsensis]
MDVRHGFSAVPRWRSKGVLGVALAAALLAETFVATHQARAVPFPAAPVQEQPVRGPGGLEAPDLASAATIARLEGERVEVVGERTATSSTWALPDGSVASGLATVPIWVRQGDGDGTSSADWAAVDLTLELRSDGGVRPKAHPFELTLAGGEAPETGVLLSARGGDGQFLALEWPGELPAPRLAGPRAVYPEVQPGVDLVVEATRTGFEQFFVLTRRPAAGAAPELSLRVRAEGLTASVDADGGVQLADAEGRVVGSSGTPLVWDAAVDAERLHPVATPWTAAGESAMALAPHPEWQLPEEGAVGEPPVGEQPAVADPSAPGAVQLPVPTPPAGVASGSEAPGRAGTAAAVAAKASAALPMTSAARVSGPGVVELALTPGEAFLLDEGTQYPVVVDPEYNFGDYFDTFVQTGYSSDQSGATELRLGTYDGGANVTRSFLNYDLTDLRYKTILEAQLYLWEWHSYSCSPRDWEVWNTEPATTSARWTAQPGWFHRQSTSSQTTGYSSSCGDGWVAANMTNLVQAWSTHGHTLVGMGLKAANEADSYGWKKFNSGNAGGGIPTLYVRWNTKPDPATGLAVVGSVDNGSNGGIWTNDATPRLSAVANDVDAGARVDMHFLVYDQATGAEVWRGGAGGVASGQVGSVEVPAGKFADGGRYKVHVQSHDGIEWNAGPSAWLPFTVDTVVPAAPAVSSTDYPADGQWHGDAGKAGSFALTLPAADGTLAGYEWGLDKTPATRHAATGNTTISVTPPTNGRHVLQVRSIDKAGSRSPVVSYAFYVGRAGLTWPREGSEVVRRVRLVPVGEAVFTHVKFQWRRGPDAATTQSVGLPMLTTADGRAFTTEWTALTDLGKYATWDAGLTLGHVPGPVQVSAVMATDAAGTGAYQTPWVTMTVSPDAANAATDAVGPGSVNLLTGDYSLANTDVGEFGLTLGRTASSRKPRAGFEPQAELLSPGQQTIASTDGFGVNAASISRVTNRGHGGMDSLRVVSGGGTEDSFAAVGLGQSLRPGGTYRITGWVYVPAATGLKPDSGRGLRIVGFYKAANGSYPEFRSNAPVITDGWQHLSVDFTVPADAGSAGFVRLYNGFTTAGKEVFFDDLSAREIFAPLGPQWSLGTTDEIAGTAYSHISLPYPDVATLHLAGGGEVWFTGASGDTVWWPQPGAESLTLTKVDADNWKVTELDGTVSEFNRHLGETTPKFELVRTSPPAASGKTRLVYAKDSLGRLRLTRMIAPVEPGVDGWPTNGAACTTATPAVGCEVLELVYSTSTTATANAFGSYAERLEKVNLYASEDGAAVTAVETARYAYDAQGRLREVWDPRISPALKTSYGYDADGRVVELAPPGEFPWRFRYGTGGANSEIGAGDLVDRSSGRLYDVSRASLMPGTIDQPGPDTTSTVVYAVPLNRAAGGPYDLNPDSLATWDQGSAPTDATAIFGPEDPPGLTTATATAPGPDGYRPATVHYLDASGREVNTASPVGPDAPAAGFIDTAEYDEYGNVIRSLDATNRLLALGQLPSAVDDLAALNLTQADTATRAVALSSYSTFGAEGIDLLRTRGPLLRLAVGNDPANVQLVHDLSTYVYDEGKPDGVAYHLVTTQTDALLLAGSSPEQLVDVMVSRNRYAPIDGASAIGPTSGWKIGSPTEVVADAGTGGANITARVRYDAQGRAVESRKHGSTGTDAGTTRAAYYTAGAHPERAECGGKPAWAGLPCTTWVAGAVTGHDPARMADQLPVKTVTGYNRYGSVETVTETATGPVAGATVTQSRTTTTAYDAADRVTSVLVTADGAGASVSPMARTVNTYDAATGHVTVISAVDPATGTVQSAVRKTLDRLGRMTRYEDGAGGWTASVFDQFGKPTEVTDSIGSTTSFVYDRAKEPRGFVTSVTDSVAGTISASYGPDGELLEQVLPGGLALRIGYDANRTPTSRTYVRTADGVEVATSSMLANSAGQMVTHTTAASAKQYSYDRLKRLTDVRDSVAGSCTWRRYVSNDRAGRTSLATSVSATGTCVDPADPASGASTTGYSYDSADRLVSDTATGAADWVYDPLGRITTAPVRGSPGATVTNAFWANDLIASQTIAGVARQTWSLDPIGRFSSYTNEAWAVGADGVAGWQEAVTKVNHYDSDSDSPAWIAEDASLPDEITRYVDGLDGVLAVQTGKTGARVLQLVDLHGDVMTTLPIRDGEATATWAELRHQAADEFGRPTDLITGAVQATDGSAPGKDGRYGWLGGAQRSADALAGVLLMGVRLYDPGTGRFWSPDPVPGGNATAYDYCSGDPVNCTDLDGRWSWGGLLKKVAVVAEIASIIPGPVGAAAGAISAGAYAATGNRAKARQMAVVSAAALVGAGGAVRAGFALAKAAGNTAARVGKAPVRMVKARGGGCNSFTPETPVLMADGTTQPISEIEVGDYVTARDPLTGETSAQPVLDVIVGFGDKHLIGVTTSRGPPAAGETASLPAEDDTWIATANHPIWIEGSGWTDAKDLQPGHSTVGANGERRVITGVVDYGWVTGQTVHNLAVVNVHTFVVGSAELGTLVHNNSVCSMVARHIPRRTSGVYTIYLKDGSTYVGSSWGVRGARSRINSHFHVNGKLSRHENRYQRRDVAGISFAAVSGGRGAVRRAEQAQINKMADWNRKLLNRRNERR